MLCPFSRVLQYILESVLQYDSFLITCVGGLFPGRAKAHCICSRDSPVQHDHGLQREASIAPFSCRGWYSLGWDWKFCVSYQASGHIWWECKT